MLKKSITYTDYDGNEQTDEFYFGLSKAEITEMEFSENAGLAKTIESIIKAKDNKRLIELFKKLILKSYGEKSVDGKAFIKKRDGHALSEDFEQTEAFSVLFMELANNDQAAVAFVNGILPAGMADEVAKAQKGKTLPSA
jgi:hypothetical protein